MVAIRVFGPRGFEKGHFLLDTGTEVTVIDPGLVDSIGYGARQSQLKFSRLHGTGEEPSLGYVLTVEGLEAFGIVHRPFDVHVHDMPTEDGIDGLLGMDWLLEHVLSLDGPAGLIELVR